MALTRVNGGVEEGQLLVGSLTHLIIDEVDGTDNISNFGFTNGNPDPGEKVVQAISVHCTPVLINSANARVMYIGVEGSPNTTAMAASINSVLSHNNATVTAGSYIVE